MLLPRMEELSTYLCGAVLSNDGFVLKGMVNRKHHSGKGPHRYRLSTRRPGGAGPPHGAIQMDKNPEVDPILILAPPRSFTSVLCAMLGRHPQLYDLPEVSLFAAETMSEREWILSMPRSAKHGLLRAVAQLIAGEQTVQTIALARRWIDIRRHSRCVSVFEELARMARPRILVEKSPITVLHGICLERAWRAFPRAGFIHLLRHPVSQGESLWKLGGRWTARRLGALDPSVSPPALDFQRPWLKLHRNILTFLNKVPPSRWIRIRGEDLLQDPDTHLRLIVKHFGLGESTEVISAMKHPERSPFARVGPPNAPFGNDVKFLRSPALRPAPALGENLLDGPVAWRSDGVGLSDEVKELASQWGYTGSDE